MNLIRRKSRWFVLLLAVSCVGCDKINSKGTFEVSLGKKFPDGMSVEKSQNGDFSLTVKDLGVIVGGLNKDPKYPTESSFNFTIRNSPLFSYYGVETSSSVSPFMEFYSVKEGFIYDKNLDGFPDSALLNNGEKVNLQVWVVDKEGKPIKRVGE